MTERAGDGDGHPRDAGDLRQGVGPQGHKGDFLAERMIDCIEPDSPSFNVISL